MSKKIKVTKGGNKMDNLAKRPFSVSDSLKQSINEMRLMKKGKIQKKSWREFRD